MATLTITEAMPDWVFWGGMRGNDSGDPALINVSTKSTFGFTLTEEGDFAGWTLTASGSKFKYLANETDGTLEPVSGLVDAVTIRDGSNNVVMTIDNFPSSEKMELVELYYSIFSGTSDAGSDIFSFFTQILNFDDTMTGSEGSDDMHACQSRGNDIINAMGGDDQVMGAAGNDTLDGGNGYDTLNYNETFFDKTAFKGISLNVNTGIVKDSWGDTDTFVNFEEYRGSRFKDVMIGTDAGRERFMGLRGADVIDGGGENVVGGNGGRDQVNYNEDHRFGGDRGIIVDLEVTFDNGIVEGTIRDGFGQTDIVRNIERVVGTNSKDTFSGSFLNNVFAGMGGKDSFDGGDGSDRVDFYQNEWNGAFNPVRIDFTKLSGQIIDDGFGNKENAISVENVGGSHLNDTIKGNDGVYNYIEGYLGADTLSGGTGSDGFGYYGNGEFGDTLLDFTTGVDEIYVGVGAIDGLDGTLRFNVGSAATKAGPSFYFNNADRTLYYDQDGTGLAFTGLAVLTVQAGGSVAAGDIILD